MKALENKTILVTGAGGFIGSHLVERLVMVKGVRLLLLSRRSRSSRLPQAIWLRGSLNIYGSGMAERDFLYVKDAVEATVRAACSKESIGPVNIVRGASTSIGEIAELLIEKTGAQVQINFLTDKPDGRSLRFDNAMMRRTLGDWPLVSLSDGLEEEVSAFRRLVDVG